MTAYIDLSIIVFIFNYILSFTYSLILFDDIKSNWTFLVQSFLLSILSVILNIFFIPYLFILFTVLYALFMALFSLNYLRIIFVGLIIFYFNYAFLLLIGGCYFYDGVILISTPFVSLFLLLIPIYITILHLIYKEIYKKIRKNKFKVKCKILVEGKLIRGHGYYDTGNGLLYENIPVVFAKGKPINNNGQVIHIKGINDYTFTYLSYKGKIYIKNKVLDVYVVFIGNRHNFFNCCFLLNKYVL